MLAGLACPIKDPYLDAIALIGIELIEKIAKIISGDLFKTIL